MTRTRRQIENELYLAKLQFDQELTDLLPHGGGDYKNAQARRVEAWQQFCIRVKPLVDSLMESERRQIAIEKRLEKRRWAAIQAQRMSMTRRTA